MDDTVVPQQFASSNIVEELKMGFLRVCNKKFECDRLRFAWALNHLGVDPPGLIMNRIFEVMDHDRSGWVSWGEFVQCFVWLKGGTTRKRAIKFAFRIFDLDGSGGIAPYEIKEIIRPLEKDHTLSEKLQLVVDGAFSELVSGRGRVGRGRVPE